MKLSRNWLQKYFEASLPDAQVIADALTFHAFEIESVEKYGFTKPIDHIFDVKVTPNRGHDCLCHRGIARELSAILRLPMKENFGNAAPLQLEPKTDALAVMVENTTLCPRFAAAVIAGVKVGPSPKWLEEALEAVGQKSINNIVDATNYVMFDIGQPLHAFDKSKLVTRKGNVELVVRNAKKGETMLGLDDKDYSLTPSMLVITSGGSPVSIAGIKGGKPTGIDERTTDIVLEAANWDGPTIRRTSQALKLRTDASDRFQQVISPELAAHGLRAATELILQLAGGSVVGFVDEYPAPQKPRTVSVSLKKINAVLGTKLTEADVAGVFQRLHLAYKNSEVGPHCFEVAIPFERLDITIPEDLIEEVARIIGYDNIPARELPPLDSARGKPVVDQLFAAAESEREELMARGYSEVITSVFAGKGERLVANKIDGERPYLRSNLGDGLAAALERNVRTKALLGLPEVKIFEIGTVWRGGKESIMVGIADEEHAREEPLNIQEASPLGYGVLPVSAAQRYQPFSKYPFIVRDIAMWIPESPNAFSDAVAVFAEHNRGLLRHVDLFDQFKKAGRVSYAFHLVFQSFDKTLTDDEANAVMQDIYDAVKKKGWEVR